MKEEEKSWEQVERDIETIADYYDSAASLISFGMMDRWRKRAASESREWMTVLEIGSGPGSMTRHLKGKEIYMLEPNEGLLRFSVSRLSGERYVQVRGVAEHLPFPQNTFDLVISGFSFKNLIDRKNALLEISRVLKKGGELVIVDIAEPDTAFRRRVMRFYMNRLLPAVAMMAVPRKVRRKWGRNPWKHLSNAYMNLGNPEELAELTLACGFSSSEYRYLMTHGAAIITARK